MSEDSEKKYFGVAKAQLKEYQMLTVLNLFQIYQVLI